VDFFNDITIRADTNDTGILDRYAVRVDRKIPRIPIARSPTTPWKESRFELEVRRNCRRYSQLTECREKDAAQQSSHESNETELSRRERERGGQQIGGRKLSWTGYYNGSRSAPAIG